MLVEGVVDIGQAVWQHLPVRTQLPCPESEFLSVGGAAPANGGSRRQYHRFHLRKKTVLRHAGTLFAVYTKDLSRVGIGVMAPQQFFPADKLELLLPEQPWILLVVQRCRRVGPGCYDLGCDFADGALTTGQYKEMVQQVKL